MRRHLEFLLLAVIALASLAIGAVHLPVALRTLFPVPLAFGLAAGVALGFLARAWGLVGSRALTGIVALLVASALCGVHGQRWRLQSRRLAAEEWAQAKEISGDEGRAAIAAQSALARGLAESQRPSDEDDPETRRKMEEFLADVRRADDDIRGRWSDDAVRARVAEQTAFWNWLNSRPTRFGRWTAPWPALFTLVELAVATGLAAFVFRRLAAEVPPPLPPAQDSQQRS